MVTLRSRKFTIYEIVFPELLSLLLKIYAGEKYGADSGSCLKQLLNGRKRENSLWRRYLSLMEQKITQDPS
jgi:hypothetical protein